MEDFLIFLNLIKKKKKIVQPPPPSQQKIQTVKPQQIQTVKPQQIQTVKPWQPSATTTSINVTDSTASPFQSTDSVMSNKSNKSFLKNLNPFDSYSEKESKILKEEDNQGLITSLFKK